jgi:hypothetical protein
VAGNKAALAAQLHISRPSLYKRLSAIEQRRCTWRCWCSKCAAAVTSGSRELTGRETHVSVVTTRTLRRKRTSRVARVSIPARSMRSWPGRQSRRGGPL